MKTLSRIACCLFFTALLVHTAHDALSSLGDEQSPPSLPSDNLARDHDVKLRKPSPQDIAASMNTLWDPWDEDEDGSYLVPIPDLEHCKNICDASWIACRLRGCDHLTDVRKQEL
ncbi:hypothetical protein EJ02DRAFT_420872 [Clathrospora elynae]|uniref:Uncharacterized protein n=1 Tax=Clathrospora elynae TaxID=706981 RepID=A0A6A5SX20_9PLEO|nr:hypothetical protein EJ02DRAFT_420872 [Clathrospora elynae]